ncbi:MAG: ankyrin repeat domain-containing protein [Nitrospina sp.]|nr:ankyrin repeat domain-containing protein [Nitrospina sp.]
MGRSIKGVLQHPLLGSGKGKGYRLQDVCVPDGDEIMTDISCMELHCAAEEGDKVKVQECLTRGVPSDIRDEQGRTALMLSKKLAFEIVDVLLDAGADPNARDQNGDTPLHHNSRVKDYCKYRRLVDKGADLLAVNHDGISPLEILLGYIGYLDMVKMARGAKDLTEERASRIIKDPEHMIQLKIFGLWETKTEKAYGKRLHRAIRKSDLKAVKNVLSERPFVETLSEVGDSPLYAAIIYCDHRVVCDMAKLLLDAGASKEKRGASLTSPLEAALIFARPDIVRLIDPDYDIPDTVQKRITHITIVDDGQFLVSLYPNDPGVHLGIGQNYPRGQEGGGKWTAEEVLRVNRGLIKKAGAGWLVPFLEQYAAGSPVMVDELERAYQENVGEKLKIHRTIS